MNDDAVASRRAVMPPGSEKLLDTRRLHTDHRALAGVLRQGMSVLDVGCGSGAITRDIADVVGPTGRVVGLDINRELLAGAAAHAAGRANLSFELGDVTALGHGHGFDVVTAARLLQWLPDPEAALRSMAGALKPGGLLVVLDYNHLKARWDPRPPASFRRFYDAFLPWRSEAGMDNEIADHLAEMMTGLGLSEVGISDQHEVTTRGQPDFERRITLWASVIATRGHQIVADGQLAEAERALAEQEFGDWAVNRAVRQELYLVAASAQK